MKRMCLPVRSECDDITDSRGAGPICASVSVAVLESTRRNIKSVAQRQIGAHAAFRRAKRNDVAVIERDGCVVQARDFAAVSAGDRDRHRSAGQCHDALATHAEAEATEGNFQCGCVCRIADEAIGGLEACPVGGARNADALPA